MNIPNDVKDILQKLNDNGYEAYLVGGCVRDYLLNIEPHDYDITTNATPEQVKELFNKTIDTGIKHGTVTAMMNGEGYEITTYRIDGDYSDGRHPDTIEYAKTLKEDVSRRDFTINAMAMDKDGNIIDYYNGQQDLKDGIIRCVGNPNERFNEDALRMLRAIRFMAKYDFTLDEDTREAIKKNSVNIGKVSAERIREEFNKMLMTDNAKKGLLEAYNDNIMDFTIPEFDMIMVCEQNNKYHYANVGIHTLDVIDKCPKDLNVRWAGLFHDMGKPIVKSINPKTGYDMFKGHNVGSQRIADKIMERLKFSNKDREEINNLVYNHDIDMEMHKPHKIRNFAATYGKDFINKLYQLQIADAKGHKAEYVDSLIEGKKNFIDKALGYIKDGSAITIKDLKIDGNDLLKIGFKDKEIGDFLRDALQICLTQPETNTKEKLMRMAVSRIDKIHPKKDVTLEQEMER